MRTPDFVFHLAPARMLFWSVKHINNSARYTENNEVGKSKERDENPYLSRYTTQVAQKDFQKRFTETDAARSYGQRDDGCNDRHDRTHVQKGNPGAQRSRGAIKCSVEREEDRKREQKCVQKRLFFPGKKMVGFRGFEQALPKRKMLGQSIQKSGPGNNEGTDCRDRESSEHSD